MSVCLSVFLVFFPITLVQDEMLELSKKVTFMMISGSSSQKLNLISFWMRNRGNSILSNNSGLVNYQGIFSTEINDPLIFFNSANFHKIVIP